jgi:hypothetical protein
MGRGDITAPRNAGRPESYLVPARLPVSLDPNACAAERHGAGERTIRPTQRFAVAVGARRMFDTGRADLLNSGAEDR